MSRSPDMAALISAGRALCCIRQQQRGAGGCTSGDADFLPALVRTRQKGKRVAVCSMRNSASSDFEDPVYQIKDFDLLWLDDYLPQLVAPFPPSVSPAATCSS